MGVVVWGPTWDLVPPSLASASLTPVVMFRSLRVATWPCSSMLTEIRAPAGPVPALPRTESHLGHSVLGQVRSCSGLGVAPEAWMQRCFLTLPQP